MIHYLYLTCNWNNSMIFFHYDYGVLDVSVVLIKSIFMDAINVKIINKRISYCEVYVSDPQWIYQYLYLLTCTIIICEHCLKNNTITNLYNIWTRSRKINEMKTEIIFIFMFHSIVKVLFNEIFDFIVFKRIKFQNFEYNTYLHVKQCQMIFSTCLLNL